MNIRASDTVAKLSQALAMAQAVMGPIQQILQLADHVPARLALLAS